MGKNAKLGIAAAVAVVVAVLAMIAIGPLVGVAVLVLGGLGVAALFQRLPEDADTGDGEPKKKTKQLQGKKRLDALLEGGTTDVKTKGARPSAAPPAGGGLPTWSGPDTAATIDDGIEVVAEDAAADWDTWDSEWAGDAEGDTLTDVAVEDAPNPLDNLDQLDDIDPIAEVERLDALDEDELDTLSGLELEEDSLVVLDEPEAPVEAEPASSGGAFSFTSAPSVINEDVSTADDIMAASQATELELDEAAADSELAKLLAKVQARLAAYE